MKFVDWTSRRPSLCFSLALVVFAGLLFGPTLLRGESILGHDAAWQFEPWFRFSWDSLRRGDWPFWNPYTFSGHPFLANPIVGLFYPPYWLLAILPGPTTIEIIALFHVCLLGLFTFWFGRELGLEPFAAAIAALAFALSEQTVARLWAGHMNILTTTTWMPLLFLSIFRLAKHKGITDLLLGSISVAMLLLPGIPQVAYHIFVAGGLFGLFLLWSEVPASRRFGVLASCVLMVAGGLALSAVQILPTLELIKLSIRGEGVTYAFATSNSLPPWYVITALAPDFFGTPGSMTLDPYALFGIYAHETPLYAGAVALLLAVTAIWTQHNEKRIVFFTLLGALFVVLSMGKYSPLYRFFFDFVPGYNGFRVPARHLIIAIFSMSLLTGWGVQFVSQEKRKAELAYKIALSALIALETIVVLGFVLQSPASEFIGGLLTSGTFAAVLADSTIGQSELQNGLPGLYRNAIVSLWLPTLLLVGYCVWYLLFMRRKCRANASEFFLGFLVLGGLLAFNFRLTEPQVPYYQAEIRSSPLFSQLPRESNERFRVLLLQGDLASPLSSNVNAFSLEERIETLNGYDPMMLAGYARFAGLLAGTDEVSSTGKIFSSLARPDLLSMINVRYIVTGAPVDGAQYGWELLGQEDGSWLYLNPKALPRAYFLEANRAIMAADQTEAFDLLSTDIGVPTAVVEDSQANHEEFVSRHRENAMSAEKNEVSAVDYLNSDIRLNVRTSTPGYLVETDLYYPGWVAYVDGVQQEILRANAIFRAIRIEPGDHAIEFRFFPNFLALGAVVSGIALLLLFLLLFVTLGRRARSLPVSLFERGSRGYR